ncbi:hypothetical protein ATJ78_1593 [Paramicrobacterium agarici]|uniref:Uncharacterized protein n=2 Tax=Paramicrobacterium agarici TaxID=630514 RepID=A0A2A9DVE6_9MICO|nr:hypothetical protein ATJ78_1593 [Microbacterium agarici]
MATDSDATLRREYARRLMSVVASKNLHGAFPVKDASGASPIVIALGHEKVDAVFTRIVSAGGSANLVIVDSADDVHVFSMVPPMSLGSQELKHDTAIDVHKNITMDFLVMYMKQVSGNGTLRIELPGVNIDARWESGTELAGAL